MDISYISLQSDKALWIEGPAMIMNGMLILEANFFWLLIRYCLLPTTSYNTLTMKGVALVAYLMAGYDIYFATILRYELHDRAFGELTNLSFPCIIQKLCDKVGVLELPGIDERLTATMTA